MNTSKTPMLGVAALLLSAALAGCVGGDEPDEPTDPTDQPEPGTDDNSTLPGGIPLAAAFTVTDNGTALAQDNGTLTALAGVNLTFDASASGGGMGNLTYEWDFDDGSGDQGVLVVHNYTSPGLYNVTLSVTDGNGTASATTALNITFDAPAFLFYDGADTAAEWTFTAQEATTHGAHPLAEGWHVSEAQAYAGAKSWTFQDESAGGYHDNEDVRMISPAIDLAGQSSAFLSFWVVGQSEAGSGEDFSWEVSGDGGATWKVFGSTDAAFDDWTQIVVDISEFTGLQVHISFHFISDGGCSVDTPLPAGCGAGDFSGYFIDEIFVTP